MNSDHRPQTTDNILDTSLLLFLQFTLTVCYSLYFGDKVIKGCLFDRLIITYFLILKKKTACSNVIRNKNYDMKCHLLNCG